MGKPPLPLLDTNSYCLSNFQVKINLSVQRFDVCIGFGTPFLKVVGDVVLPTVWPGSSVGRVVD